MRMDDTYLLLFYDNYFLFFRKKTIPYTVRNVQISVLFYLNAVFIFSKSKNLRDQMAAWHGEAVKSALAHYNHSHSTMIFPQGRGLPPRTEDYLHQLLGLQAQTKMAGSSLGKLALISCALD